MNPFLKPERAETWQAGFNIDTRDLLVEQDALRFKALAYRSGIRTTSTASLIWFVLEVVNAVCLR